MAWLSNQFPPCSHDGQPAENVLCVIAYPAGPYVGYAIAYWNLRGNQDFFTVPAWCNDEFGDTARLDEILGYQRLSEFKLGE